MSRPQGYIVSEDDRRRAARKTWEVEENLNWVAGVAPVVRTATWATPIFDMRPDLLNITTDAPMGSGLALAPRPIWLTDEQGVARPGGNLYVQILLTGNTGNPNAVNGWGDARIFAQEFAHPVAIRQLQSITPPQDVTTPGFSNNRQAAELIFQPPGTDRGYVRYWRITITFLRFSQLAGPNPDPPTKIYAGFY